MSLLIGTDEAGYGPNLGPLTICGTAWDVPDPSPDLYDTLKNVVSRNMDSDRRLTICDSKSIYKSGSLRNLETSVMAVLYAIGGSMPHSLSQLQTTLNCSLEFAPLAQLTPFFDTLRLPVAALEANVASLGEQFRQGCARQNVRLGEIKCEAIFPYQFNKLVSRHGNKAELLSASTLRIVAGLNRSNSGQVRIVCDKHGGRSRYAAMISHYLTDSFVSTECESRPISKYSWRTEAADGSVCQREIAFQAGGETFLPTALASMIAKYVRELSMIVWNRFWLDCVPGIRPTQGYPTDAKRFFVEIAGAVETLGISKDLIWRRR